jgi:hypothetical protein
MTPRTRGADMTPTSTLNSFRSHEEVVTVARASSGLCHERGASVRNEDGQTRGVRMVGDRSPEILKVPTMADEALPKNVAPALGIMFICALKMQCCVYYKPYAT